MSLLPVRTFGSLLLRTHSVSLAVCLAMATKKTNLSTSGKVEEDAGEYRAHFQFRNADGRNENIRGPRRADHALAKEDLAAIRAYGALFGDDREGGLRAMRAEARRIQERVAFEHEIRAAMERQRKDMTEDADPGPEEDVEDPDQTSGGDCFRMAGSRKATPPSLSFPRTTHHCRPTA